MSPGEELPAGISAARGRGLAEQPLVRLTLAAEYGNGQRAHAAMTPRQARALAIVLWDEANAAESEGRMRR